MDEERLVSDLGNGIASVSPERDQANAIFGKLTQHGKDIVLGLPLSAELAERRPAAGVVRSLAGLHEPHQGSPRCGLFTLAERAIDLLGLACQGTTHTAKLPQRNTGLLASLQSLPDSGEGKLQEGQSSLTATSLVHQQLNRCSV